MKLNEIKTITDEEKLAIQKAKITAICNRYRFKNFSVRDDLKVDIDSNVNLYNRAFKKFPVKFGIIEGNFDCSVNNNLETLEGAPEEVYGDFNCSSCTKLTSLKGAPKIVNGALNISFCYNLIEFGQQLPNRVYNFSCLHCFSLMSLKGSPKHVEAKFMINECSALKSFESSTKYVGGDFIAPSCVKVETFSGLPNEIHGFLRVNYVDKPKNSFAVFKIHGLKKVYAENTLKNVFDIINKYLESSDYASAQEELIEAGLEEYAEF